jgi:hypothetical protein
MALLTRESDAIIILRGVVVSSSPDYFVMPEYPEVKGAEHIITKGKGSGLPPQVYSQLKVCFNIYQRSCANSFF